MSSGLMERTLPCGSGVSALVHAAEVMREDELLWPLPVSLRFSTPHLDHTGGLRAVL
jgi:hypothetical protein